MRFGLVMNKFNFISGEWTEPDFYSNILPNIPSIAVQKSSVIPIINLKNNKYWDSLCIANDIEIAFIDRLSWYITDELFFEYISNISKVGFKYLVVFDDLFNQEKPGQYNESEFIQKAVQRTNIIYKSIKNNKNTQLISPSVLPTEPFKELSLDYFAATRNVFDIWSVKILENITELYLANLLSSISSVLNILKKPLWVTKFAIPSCSHLINNNVNWENISHSLASSQILQIFKTIESLTQNTKWFYLASYKDVYSPTFVPDLFWNPNAFHPQYSKSWEKQDFLGLCDYNKNIKQQILSSIRILAENG